MTDSDNVKAKYISKLLKCNVEDLGEVANVRLHRGQPACGMFHFCWEALSLGEPFPILCNAIECLKHHLVGINWFFAENWQ